MANGNQNPYSTAFQNFINEGNFQRTDWQQGQSFKDYWKSNDMETTGWTGGVGNSLGNGLMSMGAGLIDPLLENVTNPLFANGENTSETLGIKHDGSLMGDISEMINMNKMQAQAIQRAKDSERTYENVDNNYNLVASYDPNQLDTVKKMGAGQIINEAIAAGGKGMLEGTAYGGWIGGLVDAGIRMGANIGSNLLANSKVNDINAMNQKINQNNIDNFYNKAQENTEMAQRQRLANMVRNGGKIFANGGDFNSNFNLFGAGGSHEQNPYGGILQGFAEDGEPNLVEEGEVKFKFKDGDYIFSAKNKITNKLIDIYILPKQMKGKTFAECAQYLQKENEGRENEAISNKTLYEMMSRLRNAQDDYNEAHALQGLKKALNQLPQDQQLAMLQDMFGEPQQPEQPMQQPMMQEPGFAGIQQPQGLKGMQFEGKNYRFGGHMPEGDIPPNANVRKQTPKSAYEYDFQKFCEEQRAKYGKRYQESELEVLFANKFLMDIGLSEDEVKGINKDFKISRVRTDYSTCETSVKLRAKQQDNQQAFQQAFQQELQQYKQRVKQALQRETQQDNQRAKQQDKQRAKQQDKQRAKQQDKQRAKQQDKQQPSPAVQQAQQQTDVNTGAVPRRAKAWSNHGFKNYRYVLPEGFKADPSKYHNAANFSNIVGPDGKYIKDYETWRDKLTQSEFEKMQSDLGRDLTRGSLADFVKFGKDKNYERTHELLNALEIEEIPEEKIEEIPEEKAGPKFYIGNYTKDDIIDKKFSEELGEGYQFDVDDPENPLLKMYGSQYFQENPEALNGVNFQSWTYDPETNSYYFDRAEGDSPANPITPKQSVLNYAPLAGSIIGLGMSMKPVDYDMRDAYLRAAADSQPVAPMLLGNKDRYTPYDVNIGQNESMALSNATARALSGPNRSTSAGNLIANYAAAADTYAKNNLAFQQANEASRRAVMDFNFGVDKQNQMAVNEFTKYNDQIRDRRIGYQLAAAQAAENSEDARDTAIYKNMNNLFSNLGALGKERDAYKWRNWLIDNDVYPNLIR